MNVYDDCPYQWTPTDSRTAAREGWDLMLNTETGAFEIQAVDDDGRFPDDDAAIGHVCAAAARGALTHARAVANMLATFRDAVIYGPEPADDGLIQHHQAECEPWGSHACECPWGPE